ncbi:hypothetical protein GCM10018966_040430 [Streptomyces yanii]
MAHSCIEAFPSEEEAFGASVRTHPGPVTFLVDTYGTDRGVTTAARVLREIHRGPGCAIRLDSGDLAKLAQRTRKVLDVAGLPDVRIIASGGLDEYAIDDLVRAGAPIDVYAWARVMGRPPTGGHGLGRGDASGQAARTAHGVGDRGRRHAGAGVHRPSRPSPLRSAGSVEQPKDVVRHVDEATRDRETFHRAGAARAGFRHTAHADVVVRPAARAEQWAGRSPPLPGRPLGVRASRPEAE